MVWKNISGVTMPSWLNDNYARLQKIGYKTYLMTVKDFDSNKQFRIKIKAILPMKYLFKFTPEKWEKDYQAAMKKIEKEEERLRLQADAFRTFQINKLGICNYDRLLRKENTYRVNVDFSIDKKPKNEYFTLNKVYCIPGDNRTLIPLNKKERWDKIWIDPKDKNYRIITILPGKKIAMLTPDEYQKLNFEKIKKEDECSIDLTAQTSKITSAKALKEILDINYP